MGCSSSDNRSFDTPETTEEDDALNEFEQLKMTKDDVCRLQDAFIGISSTINGTITLMSLLQYVGTSSSLFIDRVHNIFTTNVYRELNFRAFVLSVWNFCTFSRFNIELFLFDLYDRRGSELLSSSEISIMLQEMHSLGSPEIDVYLRRALDDLRAHETIFTSSQFLQFMSDHQSTLAPVFKLQRLFQQKLGGFAFWIRQIARRQALSKKTFVSTTHLLHSSLIVMKPCSGRAVGPTGANSIAQQSSFNNKVYAYAADDSARSLRSDEDSLHSNDSDLGPLTPSLRTSRRVTRLTIGPPAPSIYDTYNSEGFGDSRHAYDRPHTPMAARRRRTQLNI